MNRLEKEEKWSKDADMELEVDNNPASNFKQEDPSRMVNNTNTSLLTAQEQKDAQQKEAEKKKNPSEYDISLAKWLQKKAQEQEEAEKKNLLE